MSNRTISLDDPLYEYLQKVSLRESDLMRRLREETLRMPEANMQIAPEQGQFMTLLLRLMNASRCLEVGTFTGYSSLCIAAALPPDGRLITCDTSVEWTAVAQRYWQEAGVANRIELLIGPGEDSLEGLLSAGQAEQFDFAFIDADKTNYLRYYELCLGLLRSGGLIAIDNTLWNGAVIDRSRKDLDTCAIRDFNEFVQRDDRVQISMVPIGDGLTLARKS